MHKVSILYIFETPYGSKSNVGQKTQSLALPNKSYHNNEMRIIDIFSSTIFTTRGKLNKRPIYFFDPQYCFWVFSKKAFKKNYNNKLKYGRYITFGVCGKCLRGRLCMGRGPIPKHLYTKLQNQILRPNSYYGPSRNNQNWLFHSPTLIANFWQSLLTLIAWHESNKNAYL